LNAASLERLHKAGEIIQRYSVTEARLRYLHAQRATLGFDFDALPYTAGGAGPGFEAWRRTDRVLHLDRTLLASGPRLTELLDAAARAATDGERQAVKKQFCDAAGEQQRWLAADLTELIGAPANVADRGLLNLSFPGDFVTGEIPERLVQCFELLRRTGAS